MRAARIEEKMRRERARSTELARQLSDGARRGNERHAALDAWVVANRVRIEALERQVADLSAALEAHQADDKRHTGKKV